MQILFSNGILSFHTYKNASMNQLNVIVSFKPGRMKKKIVYIFCAEHKSICQFKNFNNNNKKKQWNLFWAPSSKSTFWTKTWTKRREHIIKKKHDNNKTIFEMKHNIFLYAYNW